MKKLVLVIFAALAFLALSGCDQLVSRSFGGSLEYKLPAGAQLVTMTWKGTSLWVLYYLPANKSCVFSESSASGIGEGQVTVPNCDLATAAASK